MGLAAHNCFRDSVGELSDEKMCRGLGGRTARFDYVSGDGRKSQWQVGRLTDSDVAGRLFSIAAGGCGSQFEGGNERFLNFAMLQFTRQSVSECDQLEHSVGHIVECFKQ